MLKNLLVGGCVAFIGLTVSLPALAQQKAPATQTAPAASLSQGDKQKFAGAVKQILALNKASEAEAMTAIRKEGLTEQRFSEILATRNNPQQKPQKPIEAKENQSYDRAVTQLVKIQKENETKAEQAVKSQGLDVKRFNQIFEQVRSNPQLRQEIQTMIRS
jgi:3-hydroxyisobutyrate dehydrogenase-like beta-hydroxyacid dehydrogenase